MVKIYFAYIAMNGHLAVRLYTGEQYHDAIGSTIKEEIGLFPANNDGDAKAIALRLLSSKQEGRPDAKN